MLSLGLVTVNRYTFRGSNFYISFLPFFYVLKERICSFLPLTVDNVLKMAVPATEANKKSKKKTKKMAEKYGGVPMYHTLYRMTLLIHNIFMEISIKRFMQIINATK